MEKFLRQTSASQVRVRQIEAKEAFANIIVVVFIVYLPVEYIFYRKTD